MKSKETFILDDAQVKSLTKRLVLSRMRILDRHGFYGIMLMHMKFSLDSTAETAYTDGDKICFSPEFLNNISDSELDFIMMHEILHVSLKHCFRNTKYDPMIFNIACDIVVNSNILQSNGGDIKSITLKKYGESMHTINKMEGYNFTAEEVYDLLIEKKQVKSYLKNKQEFLKELEEMLKNDFGGSFDDHTKWKNLDNIDRSTLDEINKLMSEAASSASRRNPNGLPLGVEREVDNLLHPSIDWRLLLNDFIQNDITDYSFNPPDKRFNEYDFYLPDFNVTSESVDKILFMVDTSGSIDYLSLSQAYAEIKGAINQFCNVKGYLGFFDSRVYDPVPFDSVDSLEQIRPKGGGGTDFHSIFRYIKDHMNGDYPKSVIIITDGYAPFPNEESCLHLPVLWLISNDEMKPIYGTVARFKIDK